MSSFYRERNIEVERDDQEEVLQGKELVGREINLKWEDGNRYDAVVVRYYEKDDEYKLVYTADDGVEVANIHDREWYLLDKKLSTDDRPVLTGAIIKFIYPKDQKTYKAMVYHHSDNGEQLKVCYLDEHSTDAIGGCGWSFVTQSPCAFRPSSTVTNNMSTNNKRLRPTRNNNVKYEDPVNNIHDSNTYYDNNVPNSTARQASRGGDTKYGLDLRRGRVSKKPWVQ